MRPFRTRTLALTALLVFAGPVGPGFALAGHLCHPGEGAGTAAAGEHTGQGVVHHDAGLHRGGVAPGPGGHLGWSHDGSRGHHTPGHDCCHGGVCGCPAALPSAETEAPPRGMPPPDALPGISSEGQVEASRHALVRRLLPPATAPPPAG